MHSLCALLVVLIADGCLQVAGFSNSQPLAASGVKIANTKYMFLRCDGRSLLGKKGTAGIHCVKTGKVPCAGLVRWLMCVCAGRSHSCCAGRVGVRVRSANCKLTECTHISRRLLMWRAQSDSGYVASAA